MRIGGHRCSWYLVASGLWGLVAAASAGVACIRSDCDRSSRPPLDSSIQTDVESTKARTMRPLGSDGLMVDENGIIWRGDQPVGVWGVNGGEVATPPELGFHDNAWSPAVERQQR